jgi:CTP-dependent riboflavin kinase
MAETITLHGKVVSGLGQSRSFTGLPWVKKQFISLLGIDPSLGTFNIRIINEDLTRLKALRESSGILIPPLQNGFCAAHSFMLMINGKVKGAAMFPHIANYPEWQMEIVSDKPVREELGLKEGDAVEVVVETGNF